MLKITLFAAAVATAAVGLAGTSRTAQATDYPYCAIAGGRHAYENCGYFTLEQCLASVSGVGGHCSQNPRYSPRSYSERHPDQRERRYR